MKLYYSIHEVAAMLGPGVNESTLRYWEKEFEQLAPRKAGRGVRQYTQKDIDLLKLIYHLVKEKGMTLKGAKSRLAVNKEKTDKNFEVVSRLKQIRQELMDMKQALDGFTYTQMEELRIESWELKITSLIHNS